MTTDPTDREHTWAETGIVIDSDRSSFVEESCTECGATRFSDSASNSWVPARCHGSPHGYQEWRREKIDRQDRCDRLIRANSNWGWLDEAECRRGLIPKPGRERRVAALKAISDTP